MVNTTRIFLVLSAALLAISLSDFVPILKHSRQGNYKLRLRKYQDAKKLFDRVEGLREHCTTMPTTTSTIYCDAISQRQQSKLLEATDILSQLTAEDQVQMDTVAVHSDHGRARRSVAWNLDRLNDINDHLDGSFKDEAEVDVYIVGSGIMQDHSEFGNRATQPFNAYPNSNIDCDGSGTMLASLAAGRSMGIARLANIKSVKVKDCDDMVSMTNTIRGLQYVTEQLVAHPERPAVVLIGFTIPSRQDEINAEVVDLSSKALVVTGAGDLLEGDRDLDSCKTTPASAKGMTALDGVVTVGATNEDDHVVSKIGSCVDLFAPGYAIPAAGTADSVDRTMCTGSLCSAALAAGVIAQTLRSNSKLGIEVQKSMLINGATNRDDLKLTFDEGELYEDTHLIAETKWRLLYYACGYYKDPTTPQCTSYTAWCDNVAVSTFDGNTVPLYRQTDHKCRFVVFRAESGERVTGSFKDCSLANYTISLPGVDEEIDLRAGPYVAIGGEEIITPEKLEHHTDSWSIGGDSYTITYENPLGLDPRQPSVVVDVRRDGAPKMRVRFDCTSKVTVELLDTASYRGTTGGLCGLYDNVGTNDYQLPDGTIRDKYSTEFHEEWMDPSQEECKCKGDDCDSDGHCDDECTAAAEKYCSDKLNEASEECLDGVSRFREELTCIKQVSRCCCDAKDKKGAMPDLDKECCKESYFGNFERGRPACKMCTEYDCKEEAANDHCKIVDSRGFDASYEYLEVAQHLPDSCCHYLVEEEDRNQICVAPRNRELSWDRPAPHCAVKKCVRPEVNEQTILTPDQPEYDCGAHVTITCTHCYDKDPETQIIQCISDADALYSDDARWNEEITQCQEVECPEPRLPWVDNDNGVTDYPLSWVVSPFSKKCDSEIEYGCDICYDQRGDSARCTEEGRWDRGSRCSLRHCEIKPPSVDQDDAKYPLKIVGVEERVERACNKSIEYHCMPNKDDPVSSKCYDLIGEGRSTCRVDDNMEINWDTPEPYCRIRQCNRLDDFTGPGFYSTWLEEEYKRIWLTAAGPDPITNCGSTVTTDCEDCHYLFGDEERICQPDGTWNGTSPTCLIKTCPEPANDRGDTHAAYTHRETYECNSTVTFSCEKCWEYDSGDDTHRCASAPMDPNNPKDKLTEWIGEEYRCKQKQCPALVAPENGYVVDSATTNCGESITFACDHCYELEGDSTLLCRTDKTWSSEVPTCVRKECEQMWPPIDGDVENSDGEMCDSIATFTCDKCFYMDGSDTSTCQDNKRWSNPAPECIQYECDVPSAPSNGRIISELPFYFCGEKLQYECEDCYNLAGSDENECLAGAEGTTFGTWRESQPTCEIRKCARPEIPENTAIIPDQLEYDCGKGFIVECPDCCYENENAFQYICTPTGWDKTPVDGCKMKQCPPPEDLEIRALIEDKGKPDGWVSTISEDGEIVQLMKESDCHKKIHYSCDKCYNLRGNPDVECLHNKTWSEKPVCEQKTCEAPEELTTHLSYEEEKGLYSCNEAIKYDCKDQCWDLVGEETRRCVAEEGSEAAHWDVPAPVCQIRQCPVPASDDPHLKIEYDSSNCGAVVRFTCPACFRLVGAENAECTPDRVWTEDPPVCEPVCCPEIEIPVSDDPTYQVELFNITYLHDYTPDQKEQCGDSFVCQQAEIACEECHEYVENGVSFESQPTRVCEMDTENWTHRDAVCTRKVCETRVPDALAQHVRYIEPTMEDKTNCGDRVELECTECYETTAPLSHRCEPSKEWSDPIPTCTLKECPEEPAAYEHCRYQEPNARNCGDRRVLTCEDCWHTERCEEDESTRTVECRDDKAWTWLGQTPPVVKRKQCVPPPEIAHASSTAPAHDTYECGQKIKYWCEDCYKFREVRDCSCAEMRCVGRNEEDCTMGSWEPEGGSYPTCELKTCPALEDPEHGSLEIVDMVGEWGCGSRVRYQCETGYEIVNGDAERTCSTLETWTGETPVCQIKKCTQLDKPLHGDMTPDERTYGTVVHFSCDSCHEFPEEQVDPAAVMRANVSYPRYHILACEATGNWNGSEPFCRAKTCDRPDSPSNGRITWERSFECGDSITYSCDPGYYITSEHPERRCGADKQWEGDIPECRVKTCPEPGDTEFGEYTREEVYVVGETVEYSCDFCTRLVEGEEGRTLTCEDPDPGNDASTATMGQWDKKPPTCEKISCPVPPTPAHGHWIKRKPNRADNDCSQGLKLICDDGYHVEGWSMLSCQITGTWSSGRFPTCEKDCCPDPDPLRKGTVNQLDDDYCLGSRIEYSCADCYSLRDTDKPTVTYTCLAGGEWSYGADRPACDIIQCPYIYVNWASYEVLNYMVAPAGFCGETREYSCIEGYEMKSGNSLLSCGKNGQWDAQPPVCERKPCDGAGLEIANGDYRVWNQKTSSLVEKSDSYQSYISLHYSCEPGYVVDGESKLECSEQGRWDNRPPRCVLDKCPAPPKINDGTVTKTGHKQGDTATYSCNSCYQLSTYTDTLTCHDGEWIPERDITCEKVTCLPPGLPANFKLENYDYAIHEYECSQVVDYECEDGFIMHGSARLTCGQNGKWSSKTPICANIACPDIGDFDNGDIEVIDTAANKSLIFKCDEGYRLSGADDQEEDLISATMTCYKGQWLGTKPVCALEDCGDPGEPDFSTRTITNAGFTYRGRVTYTCDSGYELRGSAVLTCQADGTWDALAPKCFCTECPMLEPLLNGRIVSKISHTYNSVVRYECKKGFVVTGGSTERTCLETGEWSGTKPTCERAACPTPPMPQGGQPLTIQQSGYQFGDSAEVECPNVAKVWTQTCGWDGMWMGSANVPSDCSSCKLKEVTVMEKRRAQIGEDSKCFAGSCDDLREEEILVPVLRNVTECS